MDIVLCVSEDCPYKSTCLRATREKYDYDNIYQTWTDFEILCSCDSEHGFDYYIPINNKGEPL